MKMKSKLTRFISMFMAFAMAFLLMSPMTVKADLNPIGEKIWCGSDVYAILDDGVLTLRRVNDTPGTTSTTYDYTAEQFMNLQSPFSRYSQRGAEKGKVKKIVISNGISHIGNLLFYNVNAEKIVLGKDVQTIGENAFAWNASLKSVTIPSATVEIKKQAFYACSKLSKIDLGGTKKLGEYAFYGHKASSILIPCNCTVPDSSLAKTYNDSTKQYTYPKLRWETWVTLNPNGGTCKFGGLVRVYKEKYEYLPTPKRSGYTFMGWYVEQDNEQVKVTEKSKIKSWEPTLVAKWSKKLKTPSISSLTKKSKGFKLKVKLDSSVSGWVVQYSTDKDFDDVTQKTYSKSKKTVSISGLKSKKKYYVRVRTYTMSGSNKVYSGWSKVKTIKTK
ncbi:MAG: leucine-rich repeat protein [Roseburia sp.]|nr:leucine-rich repeat protein [Roseburia sp.]